jgi:hypothetical protein
MSSENKDLGTVQTFEKAISFLADLKSRTMKTFMPAVIVTVSLLFFALPCAGQNSFWNTLAEVSLIKTKDNQGLEMEKPSFSKNLKSYNGKKIQLKGYIIPLNEVSNPGTFMFSSLPFNVCYFCGAAGPETVVELQTKEKIQFTTRPIIIEGILQLNESDPDHHIYIVKSARTIQ